MHSKENIELMKKSKNKHYQEMKKQIGTKAAKRLIETSQQFLVSDGMGGVFCYTITPPPGVDVNYEKLFDLGTIN